MKIGIVIIVFLVFSLFGNAIVSSQGITFPSDNGIDCTYIWNCTDWQPLICPESGVHIRTCTNEGTCSGIFRKPNEILTCTLGVKFSSQIPEQLLDIKLVLDEKIISDSNKLTAWVSFENFGTEPIPIDLTYTISDNSGDKVYREDGNIVVNTENVIIKTFNNLNLNAGKYNLGLRVRYNINVIEEFEQGFEVKKSIIPGFYILVAFIVSILALSIVLFVWRKHINFFQMKDFKSAQYEKEQKKEIVNSYEKRYDDNPIKTHPLHRVSIITRAVVTFSILILLIAGIFLFTNWSLKITGYFSQLFKSPSSILSILHIFSN